MKAFNIYIKYRFYIGIFLIGLGIFIQSQSNFWAAFLVYLLGIISIVGHIIIGPLRLIQGHMEEGDFDGADKVLKSIWFPNLLLKPIRSTYFTIKGYVAMSRQDNVEAEKNLEASMKLGSPMKEAEGANYLQMGALQLQKGTKESIKKGEEYIRMALKAGLPDNESKAMAHMQLVGSYINKRQFKAAKDHFKKAKECKPTTPQLVSQIKMMESQISRLPG
jgi:tetratricopeptide (TPR) repeat protein